MAYFLIQFRKRIYIKCKVVKNRKRKEITKRLDKVYYLHGQKIWTPLKTNRKKNLIIFHQLHTKYHNEFDKKGINYCKFCEFIENHSYTQIRSKFGYLEQYFLKFFVNLSIIFRF